VIRRVGRVTLENGQHAVGDVVAKFNGLKVHHHELAELFRAYVLADRAKKREHSDWAKDPLQDLMEFVIRYVLAPDEAARQQVCKAKNTRYLGEGPSSLDEAWRTGKALPICKEDQPMEGTTPGRGWHNGQGNLQCYGQVERPKRHG